MYIYLELLLCFVINISVTQKFSLLIKFFICGGEVLRASPNMHISEYISVYY